MNVREAQQWIGSLRRFGIKPGLERVERVLVACSNPHANLNFFHIAGTNGKGSVCAMLSSLLRSAGLCVGSFTSPGFSGFNARMTVDHLEIRDEQFADCASRVKEAMERVCEADPLTEYEVLTVMSLLFFRDENVDAVVWETGLGGRYDATNVVRPKVTAITNVSFDHVDILGPKLRDIAFAKAGIIKPGVPLVTAAVGEAYRIIEQVAMEVNAPLIQVGRDVSMTRTHTDASGQTGFYRGIYQDAGNVPVSLWGMHQMTNAAVALACFEAYFGRDTKAWSSTRRALADVTWPLRFEVFKGTRGPIVLDGAHNPDATLQLCGALEEYGRLHGIRTWRMVIGVLKDKDALPMLRTMLPLASEVIVCHPNHARGRMAQDVAQQVAEIRPGIPVQVIEDVKEATRVAIQGEDALVIWGSLYMVEDARKAISQLETNYWT